MRAHNEIEHRGPEASWFANPRCSLLTPLGGAVFSAESTLVIVSFLCASQGVCYSSDGQRVASVSDDKAVAVYAT